MSEIKVIVNMLHNNEEIALENKKIFDDEDIFVINLMSAPGSGKTSILEKLICSIKKHLKIAVIEGDIYTTKDADRIEAKGVPVVQINTSGACHLDADMIRNAALNLDLRNLDMIIIENVGNLVCPAEFEVGEDMKVCVLSVTEGNDKPLKYPLMFEKSEALILNKIDLIPFTDFSSEEFYKDINTVNSKIKIFETSCTNNKGIDELCNWILQKANEK
ncbi:hydantoin utilization protein A [Clostridium carboxidivorans P7]|uniref:Hydrogenase accessory protein HypB n=1 Tax=Clostridium carboxidivorans P7 TaxID=536227 RepID=C6PTB3_9CLOT|nr:hydrogenase nickel incorporation protein HypB [Clostridium carboxidivorans]AKN30474.1 hydantoin utilization protein A [Clostridium carboxidivorans P7]EET87533.1 hydrogenase accessory protein HypB [Clostridium carboxidivorans P7]EFG86215.1 hydrogenase accessory protein HypB [Clostridium carboxidivorans P7]